VTEPIQGSPSTVQRGVGTTRLLSFLADVVCTIVFVALGRNAHSEGSAVGGTLKTAAPFLIAVAISWVVVLATDQRTGSARHLPPVAVAFGVPVWIGTVAVGMLLRHTAFDKGTAFSFVVVAVVVLGVFLLGWRGAWSRLHRPPG
jgi:Protein of unknown function (DUF3054)